MKAGMVIVVLSIAEILVVAVVPVVADQAMVRVAILAVSASLHVV